SSNSIKIVCADTVGYTVYYERNGGDGAMMRTTVRLGETYIVPECGFTAPDGAIFSHFEDHDGRTYRPGDKVVISQDKILYAIWVERYVTVTFDPGEGGGLMAEMKVLNDGRKFTVPECTLTPPEENYVFYYWEDDAGHWYSPGYEIKPNRTSYTMTALWRGRMCTITFDPNGGTAGMENGSARYGRKYALPVCTYQPPSGKAFFCYSIGGVLGYEPGDEIQITDDITVKVIWTDAEVLSEVYCTIGAPVVGEHPNRDPVSHDPEKYDVELDSWKLLTTNLGESYTFSEDKTYTAHIWFYPKHGYTCEKGTTTFYINGKAATFKGGPVQGGFIVCLDMPSSSENTITKAAATITEPTPGWRPQDVNETIESADPSKYTVEVLRWYKQVEGTMAVMDASDNFAAGGSYSPVLKFTPVGDCSFNGDTVFTLNARSITKSPYRDEWSGVTFRINDPEGGILSGKVTSFLDSTAPITLKLYSSGSNSPLEQKNVAGSPADYSFAKVPAGNYVLAVF
ncbi:MAG: InlB B-repeat-containing protein, partial [Clostridia bacterium]|nr:InlB B-repeat-containing protein [Clostridia bacterium]